MYNTAKKKTPIDAFGVREGGSVDVEKTRMRKSECSERKPNAALTKLNCEKNENIRSLYLGF